MSYTPTSWHKGDKVTAEKLNKIEQGIVDAEQSGSSLPDYSEANNGDVLTINNGKPEWLTGGGGAIVAYVSFDEAENYYKLDKTAGELKAAVLDGKYMQIEYHLGEDFYDGIYVWPVCNCYFDADEPPVFVFGILKEGGQEKTFSCNSADDFPVCDNLMI